MAYRVGRGLQSAHERPHPDSRVGTGTVLEEVDVNGWVDGVRGATQRLRTALAREDGQGMTEYGLILILIAIIVVLMLGVLGHQVNNTFSNISNGLGG